MLNRYARAAVTRILTPVARLLLRLGISPDVVTILGTLGVVEVALTALNIPHGKAGADAAIQWLGENVKA